MDKSTLPSVGIGVPVYNNSKHISKALDSMLKQTYKNIIFYIVDDCSDDGTEAICRSYAEKDNRIRYSRNKTNIGANANHVKALSLAATEYFMFGRAHEILSPNLVEECVKVLEQDKKVVLAFSTTKWIDEDDTVISNKPIGYFDTRGFNTPIRCALVFWGNYECFYGLSKTSVLEGIRGLEPFIGGDLLALLEKALIGSFAHVDSCVRYRRFHYHGETYKKRMQRYKKSTYSLKIIDRFWIFASVPFYLFASVVRSKVSISLKPVILMIVLFNAPLRYFVSRGKQVGEE